jgi:hypothetical protein
MFQHDLLGTAILLFLWHVWVKHHFYTPQNIRDIKDEVDEWLEN